MLQTAFEPRRWSDTARQLHELLTTAAEGALKRAFPYVLPLRHLRVPVSLLRGRSAVNTQSAAVIMAGEELSMGYLSDRFFEGLPEREPLGTVPVWALPRVLRKLRQSADLTIVRLDTLSASLFFDSDYLRVPEWVGMSLAVPNDIGELSKRSSSLNEDLRIVRRSGLASDISRAEKDFLTFYHTMYVPLVRLRYGRRAVIRSVPALRRWFHRGALARISRNGEFIAGGIFFPHKELLHFVALGAANGEWKHVKSGAISALYLLLIKVAREIGCKRINFGGCRSSLTDGLLRYKRKWGMTVMDKWDNYYDYLVYWKKLDPPVASFLARTPLIFRDRGGLSALMAIEDQKPATGEQVRKAYHSMWLQGLNRLYIASNHGWESSNGLPPETRLLDTTALQSCTPSALLSCT